MEDVDEFLDDSATKLVMDMFKAGLITSGKLLSAQKLIKLVMKLIFMQGQKSQIQKDNDALQNILNEK